MAQLVRAEQTIAMKLGPLERLISVHFAPVEMETVHLHRVEVVEDVWTKVRGVRAPFTWSKDRFCIGTRRGLFGKDFTAVYGIGRGICVDFDGGTWSRFIATVPYPEDVAALLRG
ncbi:MAG TPA: hypothetical protein VMU99_02770 [Acidimicrobiales bacterium]|nr:hypothetical protein [Acidimicrobiales bacterium]